MKSTMESDGMLALRREARQLEGRFNRLRAGVRQEDSFWRRTGSQLTEFLG